MSRKVGSAGISFPDADADAGAGALRFICDASSVRLRLFRLELG
jgi:hypothetical protein